MLQGLTTKPESGFSEGWQKHIYVKKYSFSHILSPFLNSHFTSASQIKVIPFNLEGENDVLFPLIYSEKLLLFAIFF